MKIEANMKIVVTNDDGYDQPGLAALVGAVKPLGEVTVVAPATPQSCVGHRVTMRVPIRVEQKATDTYIVHGTPADCSRLAIKVFAPDADWIVAGINPGANLGSDVYQSGTVAAAREAAILGKKAIAISQYIAKDWTLEWSATRSHVARLLPETWALPLASGQFWNINLPSPITLDSTIPLQLCPIDKNPHHYQYIENKGEYRYEGVIHDRSRTPGSDVDICFTGNISITRMEI
jgi:5'-nucleotidase